MHQGAKSPYYEWTVRFNGRAFEGRDVWENCPVHPGRNVFLFVADLPPFAARIGRNRYWKDPGVVAVFDPVAQQFVANSRLRPVNSPVVEVGPWPWSYYPLTVGCELAVGPSYYSQTMEAPDQTDLLAPDNGLLAGFDLTYYGRAHPANHGWAVWAEVTDGGNLQSAEIWLRHPSGLWAPTGITAPGGMDRWLFRVPEYNGADRLTLVSGIANGASTANLRFTMGELGALDPLGEGDAEAPEYNVRFGAVECPPYLQLR